tara:strand:+ start:51 stop:698 length:648 start_codon:yes stop_codon:yes gene_type:complete
MALTKVNRGGLNTGISDSSDGTAITISSGEVATFAQSPVGTGMDRLLSSTTTSAASSVDISNTFLNSTYDTYLIIFRMTPSSNDVFLNITFATDGSTFQTGNIYGSARYNFDVDDGAGSFNAGGAWTVHPISCGNSTGENISGFFYLVNANSTTFSSSVQGFCNWFDTSGDHRGGAFTGAQITSARDGVVNGLRFSFSSGNTENSEVTVYGLDKN